MPQYSENGRSVTTEEMGVIQRTIFDNSDDAMAMIDGEDGCVLNSNRAMAGLMGFKPGDLQQLLRAFDDPEGRLASALARIRQMAVGMRCLASDLRVAAGPREGTVVSVNLLRCEVNGRQLTLFLACDSTERKRIEELSRVSEERYRHLFEHSPVGEMVVSAATHVIEDCNDASLVMIGRSRDQTIGARVLDIFADTGDGLQCAKEIQARV